MAEAAEDEETKKRLADTNMENYGGKEHRDKQRAIAEKQKEWQGCGKEVGKEVWRIEKFKVVKQQDFQEKFYDGDSYIVLHSYKEEGNDNIKYNVHFWLGKDTTQDEAGAAAIKTVEVDDFLGDLPVQYRQVQGHETKEFSGLWGHMQTLSGGVESGFRKVGPKKYTPRLVHVSQPNPKKKKIISCDEVTLSVDSLNNCDAFVLDTGLTIYDFRPQKCSVWEKRAANDYVNQLKSERGKVANHIINWGDEGKHADAFWEYFDGRPDDLPAEPKRLAIEEAEKKALAEHKPTMYHVTDDNATSTIEIKKVKELEGHNDKFDRQILKDENDDCLIIDCGDIIYSWVGSEANRNEIGAAMSHACQWLKESGRPMHTPIVRVLAGGEPDGFFSHFGK